MRTLFYGCMMLALQCLKVACEDHTSPRRLHCHHHESRDYPCKVNSHCCVRLEFSRAGHGKQTVHGCSGELSVTVDEGNYRLVNEYLESFRCQPFFFGAEQKVIFDDAAEDAVKGFTVYTCDEDNCNGDAESAESASSAPATSLPLSLLVVLFCLAKIV